MVERNEKGKVQVNSLDLEIFMLGLFEVCKTEQEVEWVKERIDEVVEYAAETTVNEFEN